MFKLLRRDKGLIFSLAVNDFSTKYAGSVFGVFWAFFQPIVTILIYAFVFQYGLKSSSPVEGRPYIYWFAAGMIPWFYLSEGIRNTTNVFFEYSYLVKKVLFDIEILPIIKIVSALFVHFIFVVLLFVLGILNKQEINIFVIQILYYLFCNSVFIYVLGRITSTIILFFRDLGQIVNIVLDIGLWATPIIWPIQIVPSHLRYIVMVNPIYYITEGYRDSLINEVFFWEKLGNTIYFWICILVLGIIGKILFNKMRSQFADVL